MLIVPLQQSPPANSKALSVLKVSFNMKVSVVMPAYQAERYIEAAICSVLRQTWRDFQLLVIDDCSRDATVEIVQRLMAEDSRIVLLQNGRNRGVSYSRNVGVQAAEGEWIAFLDSDDLWREDKLEKQLALLDAYPEAMLSYTASAFIDAEGHYYSYIMAAQERISYRTLLRKNLLSCSSVMVKRTLMLRYPMEGDGMHEDYAVWLLMLREIRYAYGLNEPLLIYRIHSNSKSGNRVRSAQMLFRSYRYVGYSIFRAAVLTVLYMGYSVSKRGKIKKSSSHSAFI